MRVQVKPTTELRTTTDRRQRDARKSHKKFKSSANLKPFKNSNSSKLACLGLVQCSLGSVSRKEISTKRELDTIARLRKWGRVKRTVLCLLTDRIQTSRRSQMRLTTLM